MKVLSVFLCLLVTLICVNPGFAAVVPVKSIAAVTCGTDVRRRFGASVLSVVPLMHLDKSETYYVGITLNNGELVFKMSNSEYRDFLAGLERITGLKAVNTAKVPTVVRYD